MKRKLLFLPLLLASVGMNAQVASVTSPDGKLKVNVDVKAGRPVYEVIYDGVQTLDESPLGFVADHGDFSQNVSFESKKEVHLEFNYDLRVSKASHVHVNANQLVVTLKNERGMQ